MLLPTTVRAQAPMLVSNVLPSKATAIRHWLANNLIAELD